jgi:hypothetical protein
MSAQPSVRSVVHLHRLCTASARLVTFAADLAAAHRR